ncbi:methionine gamma-lyase family protein [Alkaliphilus serpentinus]|uniref:Cystathionine beta-lyase family protein involved in aluminum resistance n=1 Tax=Alkaliphilus serpentinus TaxID=1482731 RepID=A0A833M7A5_9FIRM|nr:methionine gamma-lyase family protein [Alkaliphilus serpentinus]KAB3527248.1 hypothetical protein F8153_12675 [Alkaliphilus serpentinus]
MKTTKEILEDFFGLSKEVIAASEKIEAELQEKFTYLNDIKEFNQYKVLKAMQEARLSDQHFQWTTGYGYNDLGRDKLEEVYSKVFGGEDAIVRPVIVNGTHALTLCLTGLLKAGDEMVAVTGKPYDTLDEVIGIRGDYPVSLIKNGVQYQQLEFLADGYMDFEGIKNTVKKSTTLVYLQRSTGYSFRNAVDMATIRRVVDLVKSINPNIIVMIDNCYGEFLECKEPTEVGADLIAGSLIKNPGGGLALTGGYIVGRRDLIELISYRMTSPGIGKECGLTFGLSRSFFQGLFMAPQVVCEALKSAIFCGKLFKAEGYSIKPDVEDMRSDIIQAIELGSEEKVLAFCKGIQASAPVDSYVTPEGWDMPGYDVPVVMAAGAFVQGSSIELSSDAPIKPPYNVYFQGGLTYQHGKLGAMKALQYVKEVERK